MSPDLCHGKPVIRGLRYPLENMLELMATGMTTEDILEDYENLEKEDLLVCPEFAAKMTHVKSFFKIASDWYYY
jgi:uncharacterized protein (DUF433 family)